MTGMAYHSHFMPQATPHAVATGVVQQTTPQVPHFIPQVSTTGLAQQQPPFSQTIAPTPHVVAAGAAQHLNNHPNGVFAAPNAVVTGATQQPPPPQNGAFPNPHPVATGVAQPRPHFAHPIPHAVSAGAERRYDPYLGAYAAPTVHPYQPHGQNMVIQQSAVQPPNAWLNPQLTTTTMPGTGAGHPLLTTGRPLDCQVDPGLKQKIWLDEHINLYALIKPVYQDDESRPLTLSDEGDVVVRRTPKGQVSSISQWMEAWRIFSVVYLQNPRYNDTQKVSLASDLFHYMSLIQELYDNGADWRFYDNNFRVYKQHNIATFGQVDHCLRSQALTKGQNKSHAASKSKTPSVQSAPSSDISKARDKLKKYYIPSGYCVLFLASMTCDGCIYKHQCPWCPAKHPAEMCRRPNFKRQDFRPKPDHFGHQQPNHSKQFPRNRPFRQ